MSSLHTLQLLTAAARIAKEGRESFSKVEINKKLQDIKYLSSQKKVPRLSLRKDILHLESQLQGVLQLEERFTREKNKESITVASLKQQIATLKNKLRAVEDLELDKKVDHLSFLLGEHLAKREIAGEVAMIEAPAMQAPAYFQEEQHEVSIEAAKKVAMLQRRLDALKHELEIHRQLGSKNPAEIKQIEQTIKAFEEKLQQYYEQHPEAMLQEVGTIEVKHKMLFQAELTEEVRDTEKKLPLPPPPRMSKRRG